MDDRKEYLLTVLGALVGGTIPVYAVTAGTAALVADGDVALGLLGFAMAVLVMELMRTISGRLSAELYRGYCSVRGEISIGARIDEQRAHCRAG